MKKPLITLLHYTALPIIGGVEIVMADHARLLTEAGFRVRILTGRGGKPRVPSSKAKTSARKDGASDKEAPPARAESAAHPYAPAQVSVIREIDSDHAQNRKIAKALDAKVILPEFRSSQERIETRLAPKLARSDILIVHNVLNFHFNLPLTAALYHLLDQGQLPPTIAWCHDISRYVNPSSGEEQRTGFPWDLLRTYRPELTYVAVSNRRQRMLGETLQVPEDRIRVISNGVAPEMLLGLGEIGQRLVKDLDLLSADLILLMPIRVTRAKNIEFALRVTAALTVARFHPKLIITGPPDPHASDGQDYFEQLLDLRRQLGLEREAIFLYEGTPDLPGPLTIDLATVAELYRIADIIFMPSHREGFGLPILEGGLVHRAVFATEVPAVDEVGAESVNMIAPDEAPYQVASRMREWAEQDVEQRLQRRVRQDYTWQAIFKREIEPLIAETLARRNDGNPRPGAFSSRRGL
ncbi:MAG TPA: glycosyltransferase family 4 protein [Anaerolineae bacterium]